MRLQNDDGCVEVDISDELLILHFDNPIEAIEKEYLSSYSVDMSDINDIEVVNVLTLEFLNKLSTSGISNHKIKLKIGTPIMLLKNLDQ
ncbi:hypothetical protein Lal_00047036 [Lupinus albus]|nr:hypothetical protein Lal_00047036 [Lupinus albus]